MSKVRILVVDDETSFTRLLKLNLESTGKYVVQETNSGRRAMAAVREFNPDLILLDVMMPGVDGGMVAGQLRDHALFRRLPIVFLTAAVKEEEVGAGGKSIGGFTYLAKPVEMDELVSCIEREMDRGKN